MIRDCDSEHPASCNLSMSRSNKAVELYKVLKMLPSPLQILIVFRFLLQSWKTYEFNYLFPLSIINYSFPGTAYSITKLKEKIPKDNIS